VDVGKDTKLGKIPNKKRRFAPLFVLDRCQLITADLWNLTGREIAFV
jgi:hypothetical protein